MTNSFSAKSGHVKRRLRRNEPLTGTVLEFALGIIESGPPDDLCNGMAAKLKAGQPLSDYECHILLDVWLLHLRLSSAAAPSSSAEKL